MYNFVEQALQPMIDKSVSFIAKNKIAPTHCAYTVLGLTALCFLTIATGLYALGLILVVGSRFAARVTKEYLAQEGAGLFLQQLINFETYLFIGGVVFFMALSSAGMVLPGALLLFAIYVNEATYMSPDDAALANNDLNAKSILQKIQGLVDHRLIYATFVLMCLLPIAFPFWAVILAFLCFASAIGRLMEAKLEAETDAVLSDKIDNDDDDEPSDDDTDTAAA